MSAARSGTRFAIAFAAAVLLAFGLAAMPASTGQSPPTAVFALVLIASLLLAAASVQTLAALQRPRWAGSASALLFGLWVLFFWQIGVVAFGVPRVLLPAPLAIVQSLFEHAD